MVDRRPPVTTEVELILDSMAIANQPQNGGDGVDAGLNLLSLPEPLLRAIVQSRGDVVRSLLRRREGGGDAGGNDGGGGGGVVGGDGGEDEDDEARATMDEVRDMCRVN